jgi:hypothetical protein
MKLRGAFCNFADTPKNIQPIDNYNYFQKELKGDKRKSFVPSSSVTGEK